jgi:hypothetical protein
MIPQMTATVVARLGTPPTAVDIDRLAVEFLALEEKTDQAYASLSRSTSPTKE